MFLAPLGIIEVDAAFDENIASEDVKGNIGKNLPFGMNGAKQTRNLQKQTLPGQTKAFSIYSAQFLSTSGVGIN